jgi:hypothetical protein
MVHDSLSKFASINFAIHTLAQPKTTSSSNYFSFVIHTFNAEMDGRIRAIHLEASRLNPSFSSSSSSPSSELFKCLVTRENEQDTNEVYRTFEEFCELYQLLIKIFPQLKLPNTPALNKFKEAAKGLKRRQYVELLINDITSLQSEISQVKLNLGF